MTCEICGKDPSKESITLHRVNETGVKGIWRCWECLSDEQKNAVDPETKLITDIIQNDKQKGPA